VALHIHKLGQGSAILPILKPRLDYFDGGISGVEGAGQFPIGQRGIFDRERAPDPERDFYFHAPQANSGPSCVPELSTPEAGSGAQIGSALGPDAPTFQPPDGPIRASVESWIA